MVVRNENILIFKLIDCLCCWLKRISIPEIKRHPWFLKNLPKEIIESERKGNEEAQKEEGSQSVEEIMRIVQEARTAGRGSKDGGQAGGRSLESQDVEGDEESEVDVSADYAEQ